MGAVTLTTGWGSTFAAYNQATGKAYFRQVLDTLALVPSNTRIVEVDMNAGDTSPIQGGTLVIGRTSRLRAGEVYNSKLYVVENTNPIQILTIDLPAFTSVSNTYPVPDALNVEASVLDPVAGIMYISGYVHGLDAVANKRCMVSPARIKHRALL